MQNLKITAVLQDGRVAGVDPWFPLDSILAAMWMRKNRPDLAYAPIDDTSKMIDADLPLARRGLGEKWYWACSFNRGKKVKEYVTHWHKRQDDNLEKYINFGKRRGKINHKSGKYKAYRMPLVVQVFDRLVWHAVGNAEQVRELCSMVTHIGKKPSQGYGAVAEWIVEPWGKDWSVIDDSCRPTRAIPITEGVEYPFPTRVYGIRPPYWFEGYRTLCIMPEWC